MTKKVIFQLTVVVFPWIKNIYQACK